MRCLLKKKMDSIVDANLSPPSSTIPFVWRLVLSAWDAVLVVPSKGQKARGKTVSAGRGHGQARREAAASCYNDAIGPSALACCTTSLYDSEPIREGCCQQKLCFEAKVVHLLNWYRWSLLCTELTKCKSFKIYFCGMQATKFK